MKPSEAYELIIPCPFCGKDEARPVVVGEFNTSLDGVDWGVECDCGVLLQSFDGVWTIEQAVDRWNTRCSTSSD